MRIASGIRISTRDTPVFRRCYLSTIAATWLPQSIRVICTADGRDSPTTI